MIPFVIISVCLCGGVLSGTLKDSMQSYDTIIVGLGASGATAASVLAQAGKRVLVLEAQNRIGGRVKTVPFGEGVVEVGAEWIHGTENSRVYDTAAKNNITVLPQSEAFEVYYSDGSQPDNELIGQLIYYALELTFDVPPEHEPEPLGQYVTRRFKEYLKEKYPRLYEDNEFVEEFLQFMDLIVNNYEASNNWNDVTTASKYKDLDGNKHTSWHKYGYKTFFDILLNTYNNGPGYPNLDIKLDTEVTHIKWLQEPNEKVQVTTKDGTKYTADNVIVTVSLGVLKERHNTLFAPQLPQTKQAAIDKISIGVVSKVIFSFDDVWWNRNVTSYGFIWKTKDRREVEADDGQWLTLIDGFTMPMGSNNAITLWNTGEAAKVVETLPEEEVKTKAMGLLRKFLGNNIHIPEPSGMIRSNWYSNPFTRGSYTYDNVDTPRYPQSRVHLAAPLVDSAGKPRVLFAGEATHGVHFSTVHGAADTGYREAMRLLPTASKM